MTSLSASHRQAECTRHQCVAMRYCCTRCNLSFVTTTMKASCLLHILCILAIFKQLYRMPANNCNDIDQKSRCRLKNDDVACFAWTMMMLIALLEKWWCWLLCLKNDDVDCFAWKMMMLIALLEKWWCWLICLKMMMLIAVLKQNKNGLLIEVFLLEKKNLAIINDSYMTMKHAFYKST